jgi:hypothetical protein
MERIGLGQWDCLIAKIRENEERNADTLHCFFGFSLQHRAPAVCHQCITSLSHALSN